jgi:hypothetical protein
VPDCEFFCGTVAVVLGIVVNLDIELRANAGCDVECDCALAGKLLASRADLATKHASILPLALFGLA